MLLTRQQRKLIPKGWRRAKVGENLRGKETMYQLIGNFKYYESYKGRFWVKKYNSFERNDLDDHECYIVIVKK